MLDEIIAYHRWAVYGLLIVLTFNMVVPYVLRTRMPKMIFWTRIGYFAFWALWTMTVFGGLIVWIFKLREMPPDVITMMAGAVVLPGIESVRPFKLKTSWRSGEDGITTNTRMVGAEWLITLAVTVYALMI